MIVPVDLHCAVLIPACSEPDIGQTIDSVGRQTRRPGVVVVVLNNCNDDGQTKRLAVEAAERHGLNLVVLEMAHNQHMKAGALNYGYDWLRHNWPSVKFLIQMDADSELADDFVECTIRALGKRRNRDVGALSCTFTGKANLAKTKRQAIVMWFQRIEYVKFHDSAVARDVSVVSGTGCVLRVQALEEIRLRRGHVWAIDSLVEDFELTLQLRTNGWTTRKSELFRVYTDLMPTVKALVKQRERWQRGTNDELRRYGFNRYTALDISKQWVHGIGMVLNIAAWVYVGLIALLGQFHFSFVMLALMGLIIFRQAYHVRSLGWPTMIFAATLIPDTLYGAVRNYWWLKALVLSCRRAEKSWT